MGNKPVPHTPPPPPPSLDDVLLNLRMEEKRLQNEYTKCLKEKDVMIKKAQTCIKQNNDEGAKMFLQSAN